MAGVKFGISFPQFHPDNIESLPPLGKFAAQVESLGFDSIWTLDGILRGRPFLESLSSLAYIAGVTKKVKLGPAVSLIPLRSPIVLAQFTATLDFLSSGRFILGAGLGGNRREFAALGVPLKERLPRFIESIKIMRLLWTRNDVNFEGRFWKLENASIVPKPVQPGGIPIWMGGGQVGPVDVNPKAIERAARIGDGWLGAGSTGLVAHERSVLQFIEFAKKFGRDLDNLAIVKRVYINVDSDRERAKATAARLMASQYEREINVEGLCVYGSEKDCASRLRELMERGTKSLIFHPLSDQLNQAEAIAKDVVPAIGF